MNFPSRPTHLAYQKLGDETIILDTKIGKQVHKLNDVASYIWQLCDGSHSINQIRELMIAEYEVSESEVDNDLNFFLTEMTNKKLIEYHVTER